MSISKADSGKKRIISPASRVMDAKDFQFRNIFTTYMNLPLNNVFSQMYPTYTQETHLFKLRFHITAAFIPNASSDRFLLGSCVRVETNSINEWQ
jgi:hypothetical protein